MDPQIIFSANGMEYIGTIYRGRYIQCEDETYFSVMHFCESIAKCRSDIDHKNLTDNIYFSDGNSRVHYNDMCKYICSLLENNCCRPHGSYLLKCIRRMWDDDANFFENIEKWLDNKKNKFGEEFSVPDKISELKSNIFDEHYDFDTQKKISIITEIADILQDISGSDDAFVHEKIYKLENYIDNNKLSWSHRDKIDMVNNLAIIIKNLMSDMNDMND